MGYTKKQALATPGLQRISDKPKKKSHPGLTRLDKPGKKLGASTRPRPGQGGPKPKPIKKGR